METKNTFYIVGYLNENQIGTVDSDGKLNYSEQLDFDSWKHFETENEAQEFADMLLKSETEELAPSFEYIVEQL